MKTPEPNELFFSIASGIWVGGLTLIVTVEAGEILLDLLVELIKWAM